MQSVNWKPPFNPTDENVLRTCQAVEPNWLCIHGQRGLREMLNGPKSGSLQVNAVLGLALLCFELPEGAWAHDELRLYNPNHKFEVGRTSPALYVRHGGIDGCVFEIKDEVLGIAQIDPDKKTGQRRFVSFTELSASLETSHKLGKPGGIRYLPVTYNEWLRQMRNGTFNPPV